MERKPNETFAEYKVRRAAANLAVKRINHDAKSGGSVSTRAHLRKLKRDAGKGAITGTYGKTLAAHFAKQRATPELLAMHKQHASHIAARKAANTDRMLAAA
jgi:hypothetical protein